MRNLLALLICFLLSSNIHCQEKRIALVIGNASYSHGGTLANPENDANDIAGKLKTAGFDVSLHTNLGQTDMKKVIDTFGKLLEKADVGLFFYAGHGVQAMGDNYLIPVDAEIRTENDVEYNCVDAGRVLAKMEDAKTGTNIVILDACRNNPFERSWTRNSNGNGLAHMNAPSGSLIAYSTAPGKTASDGYYRNSPYTAGLLEYLNTPNLSIEKLFKLVRVKVLEKTNGSQEPWESTSMTGEFYFNFDPDKVEGNTALASANQELVKYQADPEAGQSDKRSNTDQVREELAADIRSIAIMPFINSTGDEGKAYIADGMHDALITELGMLESLRVISRTSTLKYTDLRYTLQEIATELNVDGIVETSLIGMGKKLRIQVKLFSAFPEEQMLWTEVYESEMSDLLNLYSKVITNISDEVQLTLSPEEKQNLEKSITLNPEAYDAYMKGYQYYEDTSKEGLYKAIDYLTTAIELQPNWAPLHAAMTKVWIGLQQVGHEPPSVAGPKILEYLNNTLELDPNSPDAYQVIALLAWLVEWNWEKASNAFKRSIELNPNDAMTRGWYSQLLFALQENKEGSKQGKMAFSIDPLNPNVRGLYTAALLEEGDCETALVVIEGAKKDHPEEWYVNNALEKAAYQCGHYDKVIRAAKYHIPLEQDVFPEIEAIFEEKGFEAAYGEMLRQVEEVMQIKYVISPITLACKFHMAGNDEKAIEWIEKGLEIHAPNIANMTSRFYNMHRLYDDPRFLAIVDQIGLPRPKATSKDQ